MPEILLRGDFVSAILPPGLIFLGATSRQALARAGRCITFGFIVAFRFKSAPILTPRQAFIDGHAWLAHSTSIARASSITFDFERLLRHDGYLQLTLFVTRELAPQSLDSRRLPTIPLRASIASPLFIQLLHPLALNARSPGFIFGSAGRAAHEQRFTG